MQVSPGYMSPPPTGPINDTPPPSGSSTSSTYGSGISPTFNFHFNPGGGIGNGSMAGGGQGWMPPPPIGPPGIDGRPPGGPPRIPPPVRPPFSLGGMIPPGGPMRMPPATPPNFFPPVDPRGSAMPGWAGYLQWLQAMGGRMPPPPIGGI